MGEEVIISGGGDVVTRVIRTKRKVLGLKKGNLIFSNKMESA